MRAAGYKLGGGAPTASQPISAWNAGGGISSPWAPAGEDEGVDSLQQRTAVHEKAIGASVGRTLKMAQGTHDLGAETLRSLHVQSEQLKSIRGHQTKVESNLKASDKLLRGMETWRGAAANWMAEAWSKDDGKAAATKGDAALGEEQGEASTSAAGGSFWPPSKAAPAQRTQAPPEADPMSQISSLVSGLRVQAEMMNAELKAQSKELDRVNDKADANANHLNATNARTRKLGR